MKKYIVVIITVVTLISLVGCNNSVAPTNQDAEPGLTFDEKCDLAYRAVLMELYEYDMDNPEEGDVFNIELNSKFSEELGLKFNKKYTRNRYRCIPTIDSILMKDGPFVDFIEFNSEEDLQTVYEFSLENLSVNPGQSYIVSYPYFISITTFDQESSDTIKRLIEKLIIFE